MQRLCSQPLDEAAQLRHQSDTDAVCWRTRWRKSPSMSGLELQSMLALRPTFVTTLELSRAAKRRRLE